jgi:hypothetical protein
MTNKLQAARSFAADTLALFIFFTVTGVVNERYVVGMTWEQVLHARLLGTAVMIPSGRPYGLWRDFLMRRANDNPISQSLWDSAALLSFQTPVYASIIFFSGAQGLDLVFGAFAAAIMMVSLGRPYGVFLNSVRRVFRLKETAPELAD